MAYINEFKENEQIYEQLLVTSVTKGASNVGNPYLSIVFQDKTGVIEGKVWSATPFDFDTYEVGSIVRINAAVISYKDKLQLKIIDGEKIDSSKIDISKFALASPVPQEELEKKLDFYIDSIKDKELHDLVSQIINDNRKEFVVHPAAVRNHHEHMSGLLLHTISMTEIADFICGHYDNVDRDLLISGTLLHDVGKIIELSGPVAAKYTLEGKLIGHISIMNSVIREYALKMNMNEEKRILLEHMILSHHGQYEFGSPVMPLTKEAVLLNQIDDMDAKMNTLDKALASIKPGEFTEKLFPMDNRSFYKASNK